MRYISWLWKNSRGTRRLTALRIAAGVGQTALGLLMVWMSRWFIDSTIRTGTVADVARMVVWLALTAIGGVALRQVGLWLTTLAGVKQTNALRLRIFRSLFRRRLFEGERLHSGDVASRLSKDIEQVSTVMSDTLPQILVTMLQLCGAFLLMRWFDSRLAWTLIILTPVVIISGKFISRRLRSMTLGIRREESRIQMQVQEAMEHNMMLRSLGSAPWVAERLDGMQRQLRLLMMQRARFTVLIHLIMGCTFSLGYLLAFVWGGIGLRNGTISFGVMTSFLQLVGMIQHPIMQLLNMVPDVIHATASIDRLDHLESGNEPELNNIGRCDDAAVRLSGVSFSYPDSDSPVVSHFSHTFARGSKTALMGETGIGKTTLLRLLLGFVEPSEGRIEVGGSLCFVPQGNTLMSGSIRYNLLLAKPDATDGELWEALHTACAEFVHDLPDGIDTELGERGSGLSEGQAQRIAIARGLLHGGDIFLLDEISSALDEPTERELYRRIFARHPAATIIFITHRSTVNAWADDVITLNTSN